MSSSATVHKGVIHGKMIELDREPGLSDGQTVIVTVHAVPAMPALPAGEGIRRSAGAWQDDAAELDQYLEWSRQQRKRGRPEIAP